MRQLSVILVNTNNKPVIGQCLDSIRRHTRDLDYEIIVADNGSTDGSLEMLKSRYPDVRLVENGANLGFSKANNRGMERAEGESVILLNSDTELVDNSLKSLHDFLHTSERMGACGGTLVFPGRAPQWSYGCFPSFPRMLWITLSSLLGIRAGRREVAVIPRGVSEPIPVEYITGADLMMKRSVLDKVGLLDESFFVYFEEVDLCRRIVEAGYEIWYKPDCEIVHHIEGSFRDRKPMRERIYYTSLFKYLKKHYGYYLPAKYFLLFKFFIHKVLHQKGSDRQEDAAFRYAVIKESNLAYPFTF